ncbi:MAG: AI-2E family transporter [Cellulosilyticaceae bacterium]
MDKSRLRSYLILTTYAILLYLAIINIQSLFGISKEWLGLLTPFIFGFVIAYLLNGPYEFYRNKILGGLPQKGSWQKLRNPLALIFSYISLIFIIIVIFSILIPQLAHSIDTLVKDIPKHYNSLKEFTENLVKEYNLSTYLWDQVESFWNNFSQFIIDFLYNAIPKITDLLMGITSSVSNVFIGLIVSIYLLGNKEKLLLQLKKLIVAFLPQNIVKRVLYVSDLTNRTFTGFIQGQITDAFILGTLCFIGMSIFRFPYALLVSVIIGLTNMIPIVGPIFGCIPTTFIVLMASPTEPMRALWFIVLIIVLQQIDGNIIYPRVVGGSIGLSGLWVLFAIFVGGGKFGLLGMVLGVPAFAVIYALLRESVNHRISQKKLSEILPLEKSNTKDTQ